MRARQAMRTIQGYTGKLPPRDIPTQVGTHPAHHVLLPAVPHIMYVNVMTRSDTFDHGIEEGRTTLRRVMPGFPREKGFPERQTCSISHLIPQHEVPFNIDSKNVLTPQKRLRDTPEGPGPLFNVEQFVIVLLVPRALGGSLTNC